MSESEGPQRWLSSRARKFAPSLIGQLSQLAQECGAINLAEGIPDYVTPFTLKAAGMKAIENNVNQYRYSQELCTAIAAKFVESSGLAVDPSSQVALCCGQSGAISSALLAVVEPGDEVLVLDPAYETYGACIDLAGGTAKYVPLQPPDWVVRKANLENYVGPRTKAIVINSPNNPTGRVLTYEELTAVAEVCQKYDLLAITDEVYEHLVFDHSKHLTLAALPGMAERTIVTSSLSKTFAVTGWRIGWAIAPPPLCTAIAKIHCKLNDSPPAPFQDAAIVALRSPPEYYANLKTDFEARRAVAVRLLTDAGLEVPRQPEGGMFVWARIPPAYKETDVQFVMDLIFAGVAFVPGSNFFHTTANPSLEAAEILPSSFEPTPPHSALATKTKNGELDNANGPNGGVLDEQGHKSATITLSNEVKGGMGQNGDTGGRVEYRNKYVRVAFCKEMSTLQAAALALVKHRDKLVASH